MKELTLKQAAEDCRGTLTPEQAEGMITGVQIDSRRVKPGDLFVAVSGMESDGHRYIPMAQEKGAVCAVCEHEIEGGLPHAVVHWPGLANADNDLLFKLGRALRYFEGFPKGANVNFYDMLGQDHVLEKTYERGVEDFTLACGTGTGSVVTVLTKRGLVSGKQVQVDMPGGTLTVDVEQENDTITGLFLTGPTNLVAKGEIFDEEL